MRVTFDSPSILWVFQSERQRFGVRLPADYCSPKQCAVSVSTLRRIQLEAAGRSVSS